MLRRISLVCMAVLLCTAVSAQDKTVRKIIELGKTDNRVMELEDFLSNRIGGRVVGSHNLEDAEKWVVEQFEGMGLEVMVQEVGRTQVGFSRGPWFGHLIGRKSYPLNFVTPSYTSGTRGPQKGHVVLEPKDSTQFEKVKGKLRGAWVMLELKSNGQALKPDNGDVPFYRQMADAGVLGFIRSAKLPMQALTDRSGCLTMTMDNLPTICDILLDCDQFDAIRHKAERREDFQLEFDIRNHFFRGPVKFNNIIGIMRGSSYPDEYVLTGGHLDSYDSATGSVDDANGVCVTLEAARILAASGAKPKRTIMFCIWTAEELGLLGSKFFVENRTVPLEKISNYLNRDGGPLCASGVTVTPAQKADFDKVCAPLVGLNPAFPFKVIEREGAPGPKPAKMGSDYAHFVLNDVPAVRFNELDPKGYGFIYRDIWHTDKDLYNALIPEYLEHSVIVHAVTIYGLANLGHLLSREGMYSD